MLCVGTYLQVFIIIGTPEFFKFPFIQLPACFCIPQQYIAIFKGQHIVPLVAKFPHLPCVGFEFNFTPGKIVDDTNKIITSVLKPDGTTKAEVEILNELKEYIDNTVIYQKDLLYSILESEGFTDAEKIIQIKEAIKGSSQSILDYATEQIGRAHV